MQRVFAKLGGKYCGCAPQPVAGKSGDQAWPVYSDRQAGGAWEELESEAREGGRYRLTFKASQRVLSLGPAGPETRPAGADGPWEHPFVTEQPDGSKLIYRLDDSGAIVGPVFQLEETA